MNSLPKLAEIFGVTVDELMQVKIESQEVDEKKDINDLINLICKAIALAMGVAVTALSFLKQIDMNSGFGMLGIGLACVAISLLQKNNKDN